MTVFVRAPLVRRPITHADRLPYAIHVNRLVRSPKNPRARALYHGTYEWARDFAEWIGEDLARSARREHPELHLAPEEWWRSAYLSGRLRVAYAPALIDGLQDLHQAQHDAWRWEVEDYDGMDQDAYDEHLLALSDSVAAIARLTRATVDGRGSEASNERAVAWLTRQDEQVLRYVYRVYYPGRRPHPR